MKMDGHNIPEVVATLKAARDYREGPVCVIAKTTKGKGVSFMENVSEWHAKAPNAEEYKLAVAEVRGGKA
jgi:transketolase